MVVTVVEVRLAIPEGEFHTVASRFAGPVIATFDHDRPCKRTETLPDVLEVEVVDVVNTVLVKSALAQTIYVVPL